MLAKKVAMAGAAVAAMGAIVGGGSAISNAATGSDTSGTVATSSPTAGSQSTQGGQQDRGPKGGPQHAHTAVTGDELAKVTASVKAKDSSVTVEKVQKDPDGSYDVIGTKAGQRTMVEVSKDLKTVAERAGGPGRDGKGGRGGHAHTAVTGAELTKVKEAVKAKDASVTVERVGQDADGSYDVFGTKAGQRTMLEVSKDLATISEHAGGHGPEGRGGPHGGEQGRQGQQQDQQGQHAPQQGGEATNAPSQSATPGAQA